MAEKNAIQVSIQTLEKITTENAALVGGAAETLTQAVAYAAAVEQIQQALTPEVMTRVFMPLKNRGRLGWRTDESQGKQYSLEQIRDAWTDALLRGALPINDEVCLIGGNVYLEKNHFKRKLRQYPNLTDLKIHPGKVEMKPNGATVDMTLTCKISGKEQKLDRTGNSAIPIRLNSGQGADAALGKGERKIMAQFFSQLTGSDITLDDEFDIEAPTAEVVKEQPKQLESPAPAKATRTEQTAAALKKAREAKTQEPTQAATEEEADVPWDELDKPIVEAAPKNEEPKPEPKETKKQTVGFVREGTSGEFKKVEKEAADPKKSITGRVDKVKATRIKGVDGGEDAMEFNILLVGNPAKYLTLNLAEAQAAKAYSNAEDPKQPGVKQPNCEKDLTIFYTVENGINHVVQLVDAATGEVKGEGK